MILQRATSTKWSPKLDVYRNVLSSRSNSHYSSANCCILTQNVAPMTHLYMLIMKAVTEAFT